MPWGHTPDIWANTCHWMLLGRTAFLLSLPSYFARYDAHKHPCRVLENSDREKTGRMWLHEGDWEEHWGIDYGETWLWKLTSILDSVTEIFNSKLKMIRTRTSKDYSFLGFVSFVANLPQTKQSNTVFDRVCRTNWDKLSTPNMSLHLQTVLDSLPGMFWWRRQGAFPTSHTATIFPRYQQH